ncbi:MAG: hypothetical protein R3C19_25625 [Planctomycetaceae bacterium]
MNAVKEALEAIERQLTPIDAQCAELKARLAELQQTKEQLEAARAALNGTQKPGGKAKRKAAKPCARKNDVIAACKDILSENGPLSKDDLEGLVASRLGDDQNFSLSGFTLRFKEALQSELFHVEPDGVVSIARSIPTAATPDRSTAAVSASGQLAVDESHSRRRSH